MVKPPTVLIQPTSGLFHLDLRALWQNRELLYFLAWRAVKVRYAQTFFGIGWAVLQPLIATLIFSVIFGRFIKIPSDDLPYPVFTYAALLPWTFFAKSVERSGQSLVTDSSLIKKIYFPRVLIPVSAAIGGLPDFAMSFVVFFAMMIWYGLLPKSEVLVLPVFLILTLLTALAVSLWLSALNARYRDVNYLIPFLTQLWMYASPVVYPISIVPERWRLLYSLNPMVGVIEGFRWALLGKKSPDVMLMGISTVVVLFIFLGGLVYFKRTERTFADVL